MAIEDFEDYEEVDPQSDITITSTKIDVSTVDNDIDAYVYKDKGENHFNGNFKHWVTVYGSEQSWNGNTEYHWGLANYVNDLYWGLANNEHQIHITIVRWDNAYKIRCEEYHNGTHYHSLYQISLSTPYYLEIERDEAEGEFGTLYCRIYSDASRETLLTTLSRALHAKTDFQYIYGFSNVNNGYATRSASGYTENLDLDPPAPSQVSTHAASNIQKTSATLNGEIVSLGDGNADERGFVYATTSYGDPGDVAPSASDYNDDGGYLVNETDSFPEESYNLPLTGLTEETKYYIRAYAHNTNGYNYGDEVEFTTPSTLPGTWAWRIKVTVDNTLIDTAQTHFRITLMLNSSTGKTNKDVTCIFDELGSNANRKKIAVTKDDGVTQLHVEIEHWDDLREKAVLHISKSDWVIASDADTDLYIYYDSSKVDNTTYVSDSSNSSIWESTYKIANHWASYNWTEYKDADGVYTRPGEARIEEPTIVKDGDDWYMWINVQSPTKIEYLTSADGEAWANQGEVTGADIDCPHVYHNTEDDTTDMAGAVADDGGAQTDETTEANEATANDMTLLPAAPLVNDAYYFGGDGDAKSIVVNVGTAGVKGNTNYVIVYEYWDSDSWEAVADVVDGTSEFTIAGTHTISYTLPADWAKVAVNGITCYWIRARVSSVVDDQTGYTQPKGTQAWTVYKFWLTGVPYLAAPNRYKDGISLYVASTGLKFELNKDEWLPRGAAEEWDGTLMGNRWIWKEGGSFHMWYEAAHVDLSALNLGLATSTDGLTWTKDGGNPLNTTALPGRLSGGPTAIKVGSTYYLMTHHAALYKTTDKTNFTAMAGSSNSYIHRTLAGESTPPWWHIHDPFILEADGSTHIYYNSGYDFINLVKIPATASECMANYVASIRNAPDDVDLIACIYDSDGESAVETNSVYSRGTIGVNGIAGTAMQFQGTAAIDVPQKSIVGNATFLARIKLHTLNKFHHIAINILSGVTFPNYTFAITSDNFARFQFYKDGGTSQTVIGDIELAAETWYTIIGTYDSTAEKLKIYVNADLDEEVAATGTPNNIDRYFRVGAAAYDPGQSSAYMELTLDELLILDTAKGPEWVKATHHNLADSLLTYGDEETVPVNYDRSASILVGNLVTASRAFTVVTSTSFVLIGNLVSASRTIAFARASSAPVGNLVSATGARGVYRVSSVLIGNLVTASRILGSVRTSLVPVGALATASRLLSITKTSSILLVGNLVSASEFWNRTIASSVLIGILVAASRLYGATRVPLVLIGNLVGASRTAGITRASAVLVGNLVTAKGILTRIVTAAVTIGNLVSGFEIRGAARASLVLIGNLVTAVGAEGTARTSSVLVGNLVSASRIRGAVRKASTLIGNLVSATGLRGTKQAALVLVGNLVSASRVVGAVRKATVRIGALASASRAITTTRLASVLVGNLVSAYELESTVRVSLVRVGNLVTASRSVAYIRSAIVRIGVLVSAFARIFGPPIVVTLNFDTATDVDLSFETGLDVGLSFDEYLDVLFDIEGGGE